MDTRLINQTLAHRRMLDVQRLSSSSKVRSYNLAEHSYFVLTLFQDLVKQEGMAYTVEDLYLVARHDYLETLTSDLIDPVKGFSQKTRDAWNVIEAEIVSQSQDQYLHLISDKELEEELSEPIYRLMKECDRLELLMFCVEEAELGNRTSAMMAIVRTLREVLGRSVFDSVQVLLEFYLLKYDTLQLR